MSDTLLEMNILCLKKMLDYLGVCDLLKLAEVFNITVKRINYLDSTKDVTANLIQTKFVQFAKTVQKLFEEKTDCRITFRHSAANPFNIIRKNEKILHHFGGLIKIISVDFSQFDNDSPDKLMRDFVSNTKNFIADEIFSMLSHQFAKVEEIYLSGVKISDNFSSFNKCFPRLRLLYFDQVQIDRGELIECNFPHLEEVHMLYNNIFNNEYNFVIMLKMNPQLKRLGIDDQLFDLEFINKKLPDLQHLTLKIKKYTDMRDFAPVYIETLTSLTVIVDSLQTLSRRLTNRLQANNLKRLSVFSCDSNDDRLSVDFFKFVKTMSSINELVVGTLDFQSQHVISFINELPNLKKFCIRHNWQNIASINFIVEFLSKCKHITELVIYINIKYKAKDDSYEFEKHYTESFIQTAMENDVLGASEWKLEFGERNYDFQKFFISSDHVDFCYRKDSSFVCIKKCN